MLKVGGSIYTVDVYDELRLRPGDAIVSFATDHRDPGTVTLREVPGAWGHLVTYYLRIRGLVDLQKLRRT